MICQFWSTFFIPYTDCSKRDIKFMRIYIIYRRDSRPMLFYANLNLSVRLSICPSWFLVFHIQVANFWDVWMKLNTLTSIGPRVSAGGNCSDRIIFSTSSRIKSYFETLLCEQLWSDVGYLTVGRGPIQCF